MTEISGGRGAAEIKQMKSISHALEVLQQFSDARRPLGVTEIAQRLGLHKSSASRILATLHRARFLDRDSDSGRYSLGLGILSLAGAVLARYQLPSAARQQLEELAGRTGETVTISGWNGWEAVNLDQILGPGAVKNFSPPGRTNPVHCTSTGKVFLAHAGEQTIEEILAAPLKRYSPRTLIDPEALRAELQEVRRLGYAVNDREFMEDVSAIAAPVFNAQGTIAYVVAVTMPSFRFDPAEVGTLAKHLVAVTGSLSARLGYFPSPPVATLVS